jgi:hypothetical protein
MFNVNECQLLVLVGCGFGGPSSNLGDYARVGQSCCIAKRPALGDIPK